MKTHGRKGMTALAAILLAAAVPAAAVKAQDILINFQPGGSTVPGGFLSDSGQEYGDRGTYEYGWVPLMASVRVAGGLSRPVYVTHAPGDVDRLFVIEQRDGNTGRVRIIELATNTLLPTPFLSISPVATGGEQGLLGLAFHPDYLTNGYFYVNYTDSGGDTVIERYHVSTNPDLADPASALTVLTMDQPYANHNGGWIGFGPDGYFYFASGDGGGGGDPQGLAQDLSSLQGKILRVDVDGDDFPGDPGRNYAIPPDNPFVGPGADDEIWAYGLRNPWRCDFDDVTGDLWIADVGQTSLEEIDFQPASSSGGENYGWRCYEGSQPYNTAGCAGPGSMVFPVHEYGHAGGDCSVTGGVVYRGSAIPELDGHYFFADFCTGRVWSLLYDGVSVTHLAERTDDLDPGGGYTIDLISSFGEDAAGEIYICDLGGEIFKIVPWRTVF